MATIVGCVCTSHVPAIGGALARGLEQDAYWQPFFAGFPPVREWLGRVKPDVAVVFYNDHGLNFFLDNLPTFAVGAATEYRNEDEGWGIPALGSYPGSPALSWHIIESLVAADFDHRGSVSPRRGKSDDPRQHVGRQGGSCVIGDQKSFHRAGVLFSVTRSSLYALSPAVDTAS